jgi:predicted anti-sigma-YlaC factor YlaD
MRVKPSIILVAVVLIFALRIEAGFGQEKETIKIDRVVVMQKLDEILSNQDDIFKRLDQIEQELAVIKVRASR